MFDDYNLTDVNGAPSAMDEDGELDQDFNDTDLDVFWLEESDDEDSDLED